MVNLNSNTGDLSSFFPCFSEDLPRRTEKNGAKRRGHLGDRGQSPTYLSSSSGTFLLRSTPLSSVAPQAPVVNLKGNIDFQLRCPPLRGDSPPAIPLAPVVILNANFGHLPGSPLVFLKIYHGGRRKTEQNGGGIWGTEDRARPTSFFRHFSSPFNSVILRCAAGARGEFDGNTVAHSGLFHVNVTLCSGPGPNSTNALRCASVGYPLWTAKP